jgi:hypothetical protein
MRVGRIGVFVINAIDRLRVRAAGRASVINRITGILITGILICRRIFRPFTDIFPTLLGYFSDLTSDIFPTLCDRDSRSYRDRSSAPE